MIRRIWGFWLICIVAALGQTQLVQHSARSIALQFDLPPVHSHTLRLDGQEYRRLDFSGAQMLVEAGAPMVPFTIARVAVPPGAGVSLQFQVMEEEERFPVDVVPASVVYSLRPNNRVEVNRDIYGSPAPFPGKMVELGEPYTYRGMRVVDVRIYPVQYHPAEHRVRLLKKISVRLQLSNGQPTGSPGRLLPQDEEILRTRLLNFEQARQWALPRASRFRKTPVNYDFSVGNWYKIPVAEEGIYRLTGSFLQDQGVNLSEINPDQIQMFSHGGTRLSVNLAKARPDGLNEVAIQVVDKNGNGRFDPEDEVLFFGRGVNGWQYDASSGEWKATTNPYSFVNYYIFTYNQNPGKRIAVVNSPQLPNATRATQFTDPYRFEEERYNIIESGLDWYWVRFQGLSAQTSLTLALPANILPDNARYKIRFRGGSGSRYFERRGNQYSFSASLNGMTLFDNLGFSDNGSQVRTSTTTAVRGGTNELQIFYTGNKESAFAYLDYVEFRVQRPFIAENNYLKIYYNVGPAPVEFQVTGLPGGTNRVWDVTDFANVTAITPLQNGSTVRFHAVENEDTPKQYYVFAPAFIRNVEQIQRIQNSPNLRDPNRKGKLLVIVPDEFYDVAEELEIFKEAEDPFPLETERVKLSEIYREFSSCVPDPTAIRDFVKYAHENWSVNDPRFNPQYVFLLGDGSYDYRNIALKDYVNRIPTFQVTASNDIDSRATDIYYVAINHNSDSMSRLEAELPIGRYPANSEQDIRTYVNKLRQYAVSFLIDEATNGWQNMMTFVADDECVGNDCDEWFHTEQSESLSNVIPRKFDVRKIYLTDYETEAGGLGRLKPKAAADLIDQINRGTLMLNFYGHGDPNTWAHEQVLTKGRDLPNIRNEHRLPVWVAATCTWGKYDDPNNPAMSEALIWSNQGAIAVIAASRPTFAFSNQFFVERVYRHLFYNGDETRRSRRLGDAVLMALNNLNGGANEQKYHIFGDPTLRLADAQHRIVINSISEDTLKALSTVTVSATVADSAGNPLTAFQGRALLRVIDAGDSLQDGRGFPYFYPGGTIFKGLVSVVNGELEGSFIVPKSIKYKLERTGRISIYAWSENLRDAVGFVDTLLFYGTESRINDQEGPEIDFTFEGQPDFFDGDYVGQQPTLIIQLRDESGINLTGEVGHQIELTIDNTIKKNVTEFFVYRENSFQEGELRYTLPALPSGKHELTISAWDNLNNYSEQKITFTTTSATGITLDQVVNYPNPFSDETQFTFQFFSPNGSADVTIRIYTVSGRLIQEINDVARPGFNKIHWDGRDRDGDVLANGVYLYKIVVDDGEQVVEKIEKLAVVR